MQRWAGVSNVLRKTWKLWAGLLGLVAVIVWTAGILRPRTAPGTVAHEPGFALPPDAAVIDIATEAAPTRIDVVGTVTSERKIHLSSRLSAYIKDVLVSAGKSVQQGELLVELDQREIREQLAAAEAQLAQAKTAYQRAKRLLETKATTPQAFEAAESAFKAAQANVERINVMLSYTRIESPIDGVVTDRRIEIGDLANPGQVLLSVYDASRMRLEASVPVRLVKHFPIGRDVTVALNYPECEVEGKVVEIVGEIDPATRTQQVKIQINEAPDNTLPGAYGHAIVYVDPHPAVLVPDASVYRVGQLEYVQLVRGDRVVRRLVKTGPRVEQRIEVLSGLSGGDRILRTPVNL